MCVQRTSHDRHADPLTEGADAPGVGVLLNRAEGHRGAPDPPEQIRVDGVGEGGVARGGLQGPERDLSVQPPGLQDVLGGAVRGRDVIGGVDHHRVPRVPGVEGKEPRQVEHGGVEARIALGGEADRAPHPLARVTGQTRQVAVLHQVGDHHQSAHSLLPQEAQDGLVIGLPCIRPGAHPPCQRGGRGAGHRQGERRHVGIDHRDRADPGEGRHSREDGGSGTPFDEKGQGRVRMEPTAFENGSGEILRQECVVLKEEVVGALVRGGA